MVRVIGSPTPSRLGASAAPPAFPAARATWTDPTGAIIVPAGALDRYFAWRQTLGAVRGDIVYDGDSTAYGSGGNYSLLQRIRDNAITFGFPDGGKGMFGAGESLIGYDGSEVNGFVSETFAGFGDQFDNLDGQYFYDTGTPANATLVLQFRSTAARLWYANRTAAGDFTYSVDGGGTVTVHAYNATVNTCKFIYLSGLSANTTHTITITNLGSSSGGGKGCYIALAPVNDTGFAIQKFATSGDTINKRYFGALGSAPFTQAWAGSEAVHTSLGLIGTTVNSPTYSGAIADSNYASNAKVNPVLAATQLGFNDLTNAVDSSDLPMWTEYVKRFAGACRDAGVDGMIVSGQLPYNANWPTYGAARFNAVKAQALASGVAFVDLFYPIAGAALSYSGGTQNPHLSKAQYQTQADFLWNNLLGLRV